jgi:hypothetical protein
MTDNSHIYSQIFQHHIKSPTVQNIRIFNNSNIVYFFNGSLPLSLLTPWFRNADIYVRKTEKFGHSYGHT